MYNILGPKGFEGKYKPIQITSENVFLKMYGKEISKPKRKLGHFNVIDTNDQENITSLLDKVKRVSDSIILESI